MFDMRSAEASDQSRDRAATRICSVHSTIIDLMKMNGGEHLGMAIAIVVGWAGFNDRFRLVCSVR
jgi:hypothetical protein